MQRPGHTICSELPHTQNLKTAQFWVYLYNSELANKLVPSRPGSSGFFDLNKQQLKSSKA